MAAARKAVEGDGAVGEGTGDRLGADVRGEEASATEPAHVFICQRALLDRCENSGGGGRRSPGDGVAPSTAAPEHVRSPSAALQLHVHRRRILSEGSPSPYGWPHRTESSAWRRVSGNGAGGDRSSVAAAGGLGHPGATEHGLAETGVRP